MASLQELMEIEGVVFACEFTPEGKCTDYKAAMDLPREKADKAAQYIATVTMMFNTLADAFGKESGMPWTPQHGWGYAGGEFVCTVGGNRAVFSEASRTDLTKLSEALSPAYAEREARQSV